MWIHRVSGFTIMVATVILSLIAFQKAGWSLQNGLHPAGGSIALVVVLIIFLGGLISKAFLEKTTWSAKIALLIKKIHSWIGALLIILSQIVIAVGGIQYS